ncbi:hypothetical protein KND07_002538 [Salmonella enterica subsp. enterica serovar Cerro]|nr:hypothetical protein [Salmonella enterica subsp. enterica serovar Cerro]EHP2029365.1 hypothetical protein [Salmonella enterica subsp. enterica serovar Cerro]
MRFTDVRHYDDEGFPRHSWRYEFDNGVPPYIPVQRENPQYQAFCPPFKLTASHGRYLLVNPGLWVRRSRSVKCDAMFSPSGAFPGVDAIIGGRYPAMVMELAAQ